MVNYEQPLTRTFTALSDPKRMAILDRLTRGEASASELAAPLGLSLPAFAKHLRVLESTGLVTTRKIGRVRLCRIKKEPLQEVEHWVRSRQRTWDQTLGALESHLGKGGNDEVRPGDRTQIRR